MTVEWLKCQTQKKVIVEFNRYIFLAHWQWHRHTKKYISFNDYKLWEFSKFQHACQRPFKLKNN